ncbi:transposase [Listeria grandensis]|uniref:Transposase n=1 Tax=Listeria grandensis TaxID=1494963 RepID=A0A7X1CRA6_9LIST|nr:transposase [Listeria grandensis]MBC1476002.1 transposase [Listeria grandensis]MBC1937898.1 transposase [Listeria grandensis]
MLYEPIKVAAVTLVLKENFSVTEVCTELDIHANTLYRWLSEYEEYDESAFPGHGSALFNAHYAIWKLEKENKAL